jgi:arginine-tRNA-protein transferase
MTDQSSYTANFHFTIAQPCPYLPGQLERKMFTHLSRDRTRLNVDWLLRNGFRRSQNIAYLPHCIDCHACVSVRIVVDQFEPNRSFRRLLKRNADITARRQRNKATLEQYALFSTYIGDRHGDGGMAEMTRLDFRQMIEESVADTFVSEYRLQQPAGAPRLKGAAAEAPLVAAVLCDRLSDGISMVYSFFRTDLPERSLGSHMILDTIDFARRLGLPYVYLGYWIEGCRKITYKQRFTPQQRLTPDGWE